MTGLKKAVLVLFVVLLAITCVEKWFLQTANYKVMTHLWIVQNKSEDSGIYTANGYNHNVHDAFSSYQGGNHQVIKILSWTKKYYSPKSRKWFGTGTAAFRRCPMEESRLCSYSSNRAEYNESEVILFKGTRLWENGSLPAYRLPSHRWVFFDRESAVQTKNIPPKWRFLFNYTTTYRRDADIRFPYGQCWRRTQPKKVENINMSANRTKLVTWFVSNCKAQSMRHNYVRELSKYIPINIVGRCGKNVCPKNDTVGCADKIKSQHKFYLAFENSLCKDYITEKLWKSLESGIVPIVYGEASYEKILPPGSYIDVRDFRSPSHLADHLWMIHSNDTLYNGFFTWRRHYECHRYKESDFLCDLCNYLHHHEQDTNRIVDLDTLGFQGNCLTPQRFIEKYNIESFIWRTRF